MESARSGTRAGVPAEVFAEAIRDAAAQKSTADTLAAVIELAVTHGPCEAASIIMRHSTTLETVAHSTDLTLKADTLQYELEEGPGLDAVWTDRLVVVPDLRADDRWQRWAPAAAGLGIGSALSVHLFTDSALGSLNLYSLRPRQYSRGDIEVAEVIAAHASVVVDHARDERNLRQAIDSRTLIGQAQGMLMQKYRLTAEKAFGVLRRYSQTQNIKLVALAEQITSTGELPDLDHRDQTAGRIH